MRWVYQPVEVHHPDGRWELGRISAWWTDDEGGEWCRLRTLPAGPRPQWVAYDPEALRLLPSTGI